MSDELKPGDLAVDTVRHRLGRVGAIISGIVYLRPPSGGLEWTCFIEEVRKPDAAEIVPGKPVDDVKHERPAP